MRRILLTLFLVILALLLLLLVRDLRSPESFTRSSADGRLRLVIPGNALPAGVDPDDIAIVALDPATVTPVAGLETSRFAYRLEPEGLRFTQPVQLSMDTAGWTPRQLPMLFHRSAGSLEALNLNVEVTGTRLSSVTAELQHFSEVLGFLSVISVQITDPGDQHVGDFFYVDVSAGARASEIDKLMGDPNGFWTRQQVADPITLSGGTFTATGTLTPDRVTDRPDNVDLAPADSHTEFESFECAAESTGNQISYTVRTDFKLLFRSSDAPDHVAESPIKDTLTVRSTPFACLPPLPPPAVEYFTSAPEPIDSKGEDFFEVEIKKTPSGGIPVGQDFTLKAEVAHYYDGSATSAIGADWQLKYGRFEYAFIVNNAVTPLRVTGLPGSQTVPAEDSWEGEARFRCMQPGSALIDYRAFVHYKAPGANVNGVIAIPVSARASIECIADPNATGTITALTGNDIIGPVSTQGFNDYGGFQARWWREPAGRELFIGTAVTVHVEVENLRTTGQPAPWSISGRLYTMAGTGLEPRRYEEAPAYRQAVNALGTWSGDYRFVCRNADLAALRHDFSIETPASMNLPPLTLSLSDPGLKCLGD